MTESSNEVRIYIANTLAKLTSNAASVASEHRDIATLINASTVQVEDGIALQMSFSGQTRPLLELLLTLMHEIAIDVTLRTVCNGDKSLLTDEKITRTKTELITLFMTTRRAYVNPEEEVDG